MKEHTYEEIDNAFTISEKLENAFTISEEIEETLYKVKDRYMRQAIVINLIDAMAADCEMTSKEWMEMVIPMTIIADSMFGSIESRMKGNE